MKNIYGYIEDKTENILKDVDLFYPGFEIKDVAIKNNVTVRKEILDDEISGLFVIKNKKAVILYNKSHKNPQRLRFTIAHELGHYFLHSKDTPLFIDSYPKVMYRNGLSSSGEDRKEREANAFAASILMPKVLIVKEIEDSEDSTVDAVKHLAMKFKVSEMAMTYRLTNLGYELGMFI